MHTFKSALEDFTRPLNTSFEDSIHMPQNHNNQKRRKAAAARVRKEPQKEPSVVQQTGVVPPEWRRVTPNFGPIPDWEAASVAEHDVPEVKKNEEKNASHGDMGGSEVSTGRTAPGTVAWSKIHEDREAAAKLEATTQPAPISPMKVFKRPGLGAASSSATLEEIRRLRLREQEQQTTAVPTSPRFMPNLRFTGSGWAQPLYEMAKPQECILPEESASFGTHQTRHPKEMDDLTEAMESLGVFQNVTASPPNRRLVKQEGETPPPPDISAGGESAPESCIEAEDFQDSRKAQPVEARETVHSEANKSADSLASLSDEFEKIEAPAQDESEHNGARRKWYKGFRR